MKRSILVLTFVMMVMAGTSLAQGPPQGGQGRGGGGRGGGRGAPAPPATGPIADMTNAIVTAINNQDTAYFMKNVAAGTLWADEDGHFMPSATWINRLMTANPKKKLEITNLRVGNWDTGGWSAFNYTLDEGNNVMKGTASLVFQKTGNDWQVVLIHVPVTGPAITPH